MSQQTEHRRRSQAAYAKAMRNKPKLPMRQCHDCGKPTQDYRCPACLSAWRKQHGVVVSEGMA